MARLEIHTGWPFVAANRNTSDAVSATVPSSWPERDATRWPIEGVGFSQAPREGFENVFMTRKRTVLYPDCTSPDYRRPCGYCDDSRASVKNLTYGEAGQAARSRPLRGGTRL